MRNASTPYGRDGQKEGLDLEQSLPPYEAEELAV